MKNVLANKTVNNFTVGIILGSATLQFVHSVVTPILSSVFTDASGTWDWTQFWQNLVLYVVFWVVAWAVNSQAE